MRRDDSRAILRKSAILLLVFTIAGLPALAKYDQALPKSNPAHYLAYAIRVDVAHQSILPAPAPVCSMAKVAPDQREFQTIRVEESGARDLRRNTLVGSLQHRAPPFFLI